MTASAAKEPAPAEEAAPALDVDATVKRWLDDPRLAKAKAELDAGHPLGAARAAKEARVAAKSSDPGERASLAYLEGALASGAGIPDVALEAFRAAAREETLLAPFARLRAVELAAQLGKHDIALAEAAKIDRAVLSEARIASASLESIARTGTAADARKAIDLALPKGSSERPGWSSLALRIAQILGKRTTLDHARLAIELCDRVDLDAPRGRGSADAEKLANELTSRLPKADQKARREPSPDVAIDRVRRIAESDQGKRAARLADKLAKKLDKGSALSKTARCALAVAEAKAMAAVKRKSEALDAWGRATRDCESEALAEALMGAGRAAARGHANTEARSFFGRLEAAFPAHRLADDARFEGAKAALDAGDAASFKKLLASLPDDYPKGDKIGDALFLLAIEALERGAPAEAIPPLTRAATLPPERHYTKAGRFSYFLGRALWGAGKKEEAARALEATLAAAPLSYYGALAAARLDAIEPGRASRTMQALLAKAPSKLATVAAARSTEPKIAAALAIAGLHDPRGVDDALGALGVRDHTAPPELYAFGGKLLAIAGDPQAAHALLRTARERERDKDHFDCDDIALELPRGRAADAWRLAFPRLFDREVEVAARESGVPSALIYAVMREESAFSPRAVSVANARGLLQLIPATGARMARNLGLRYNDKLLFEPEPNLRIGAQYLASLRRRFGSATPLAVAGYNAGPGAPDDWIEQMPSWDLDLFVERIPYAETKAYVKRVWSSYFAYVVLYGGGALTDVVATSEKVPSTRTRG